MGRATAKVNGMTLAVADEWETVEGNIYVRPDICWDFRASAHPDASVSSRLNLGKISLY